MEKQIKLFLEFLENDKKLDLFLNGVRLSCDKLDGVYRVYLKDKFIVGHTYTFFGKMIKNYLKIPYNRIEEILFNLKNTLIVKDYHIQK